MHHTDNGPLLSTLMNRYAGNVTFAQRSRSPAKVLSNSLRYSRTSQHFGVSRFSAIPLILLLMACQCIQSTSNSVSSSRADEKFLAKDDLERIQNTNVRIRALHTIRRSLETYGDLTAKKLMLNLAMKTNEHGEAYPHGNSLFSQEDEASNSRSSEYQDKEQVNVNRKEKDSTEHGSKNNSVDNGTGYLRVRVGITETNGQADEQDQNVPSQSSDELQEELHQKSNELTPDENSNTRRLHRSTALSAYRRGTAGQDGHGGTWGASTHFPHHRRRRKGCPPLHGKDQLLCPSRNHRRYDVCITREQLCNHVRDCPDGEDEEPRHCFFYKPLDDQLKTLAHAVLLLVDSVMSEHQQQRRSEL